jgi:hypothetical protein
VGIHHFEVLAPLAVLCTEHALLLLVTVMRLRRVALRHDRSLDQSGERLIALATRLASLTAHSLHAEAHW